MKDKPYSKCSDKELSCLYKQATSLQDRNKIFSEIARRYPEIKAAMDDFLEEYGIESEEQ